MQTWSGWGSSCGRHSDTTVEAIRRYSACSTRRSGAAVSSANFASSIASKSCLTLRPMAAVYRIRSRCQSPGVRTAPRTARRNPRARSRLEARRARTYAIGRMIASADTTRKITSVVRLIGSPVSRDVVLPLRVLDDEAGAVGAPTHETRPAATDLAFVEPGGRRVVERDDRACVRACRRLNGRLPV